MANIFTRTLEKINAFISASPRLRKVINFVMHPTVMRVAAIVFAVAATIASGGAAIPTIGLALTFSTSLISVVAKALQLRRVDNLKLQLAIINGIKKARGSASVSQDKAVHAIKISDANPSKTRAMLKTIRDIGLENVAPVITAGLTFNVPGLFGYVSALAWGITNVVGYSGLGGYTIASEFSQRVQADLEKRKLKQEINQLCKEAGIPPFRNVEELHAYAMREMELSPDKQKEFKDLVPRRPSLFRAAINAINPFDVPYQSQNFDGVSEKIARLADSSGRHPKPHAEGVSPSKTPGGQQPSSTLGM